jgi:hypothetical protein
VIAAATFSWIVALGKKSGPTAAVSLGSGQHVLRFAQDDKFKIKMDTRKSGSPKPVT